MRHDAFHRVGLQEEFFRERQPTTLHRTDCRRGALRIAARWLAYRPLISYTARKKVRHKSLVELTHLHMASSFLSPDSKPAFLEM